MAKGEKRTVPISLTKGIDGTLDPKLPREGFTRLENVIFTRGGAASKCYTVDAIDSQSAGEMVLCRGGDDVFAVGEQGCLIYDEDNDTFITNTVLQDEGGAVPDGYFTVTEDSIFYSSGRHWRNLDWAYAGDDYLVVAATDIFPSANVGIYLFVINRAKKTIKSLTLIDSDAPDSDLVYREHNGRVLRLEGGQVAFVYAKISTGDLKVHEVGTDGSVSSASTLFVTNDPYSSDFGFIDACLVNDGGTERFVVAYITSDSGTGKGVLVLITRAGAGSFTKTYEELMTNNDYETLGIGIFPRDVYGDNINLVVVTYEYSGGNGELWAVGYDASLESQDIDPKLLEDDLDSVYSSKALIGLAYNEDYVTVIARSGSAPSNTMQITTLVDGSVFTNVSSSLLFCNQQILSKPFIYNSDYYLMVGYHDEINPLDPELSSSSDATSQQQLFMLKGSLSGGYIKFSHDVVVAKSLYGRLSHMVFRESNQQCFFVPATAPQGESVPVFYVPYADEMFSGVNGFMEVLFTEELPQPVNDGAGCVLLSSICRTVHKDGVYDVNFLEYPELPYNVESTGSLGAGVYQYCCTYEFIYGDGRLVRSAPSKIISVTSAGSTKNNVTVVAPQLGLLGSYFGYANVVLWRTEKDGGVFYRKDSFRVPYMPYQTVTFTDNTEAISDTSEVLYTTGGVLDNGPAPSATGVGCIYQGRLFTVDSALRASLIRYTKKISQSYGIEFNEALNIICSSDGGDITAMHALDDKLIIFKRNMIFATYGDGVNDSGIGSGYVTPFLVSPLYGCQNQKSLIRLDIGILFVSVEGVFLLGRDLSVKNIGERVFYYFQNEVSVSCVLHDENSSSVILFSNTTGSDKSLVYNYKYDSWSIITLQANSGQSASDGSLILESGASGYFSPGKVNTSRCLSSSMIIDTGWISPWDYLGKGRLKRVHLLGQKISDCTVKVGFCFDYEPEIISTQQIDISDLNAFDYTENYSSAGYVLAGDNAFDIAIDSPRSKCTSFKIIIWDYGYGSLPSFDLSAVMFECMVTSMSHQPDSSRKVG